MGFVATAFRDLWVIEPKILTDNRGYFFESYHQKRFEAATGLNVNFVQDNQSFSTFGVMRGLHFQYGHAAQAKLVRAVMGKILDVVVDLRKNEPTFGKSFAIELSEQNQKQLFIPKGFAHGFVVLSASTQFCYKCDNFYDPNFESGILYNDPDLGLDWQLPTADLLVSPKDLELKTLAELDIELVFG